MITDVFGSQFMTPSHAFSNIMQDDQLVISHRKDPRAIVRSLGSNDPTATRPEDLGNAITAVGVDGLRCSDYEMMCSRKLKRLRTWIIEWIKGITRRLLALLT